MIVRTWRKDSGERLPPLGGSEQHVHVLTSVGDVCRASGRADQILTVAEGRTPGCGAACHDANRSINGVPSIVLRNPLR